MVSQNVYSAVRAARFYSKREFLEDALRNYSPNFEYYISRGCHSYVLFDNKPSLVVIIYSPVANSLFLPNMLATFTSVSKLKSEGIVKKFQEKTELQLSTEREEPAIKDVSTEKEKNLFAEFLIQGAKV